MERYIWYLVNTRLKDNKFLTLKTYIPFDLAIAVLEIYSIDIITHNNCECLYSEKQKKT